MILHTKVLYDAFFKYQAKPKLSTYVYFYHEGKESRVKLRKMKLSSLSHELKKLLVCQRVLHYHAYYHAEKWWSTIMPHLRLLWLNAPIP
ncbi:hypothetical protein COLO4_34479 [Corchorus olitorius]|uniref:Uncharacterized protein n=1 Tax=Corchorus olitorius TaxID=93759 RepID=A0A1R3GKP2_9ROSI|nr:hypothetical protein COLO4_34479 [Corchorus olitorius]